MHKLIWRTSLACAVVAFGFMGSSSAGLAATGTALGVKPAAAVETGAETKTLTVGADVFIGDRVVTGPDGQVQIKFSDRTELVVGPNSELLIEDYLLREDNSAGKFAINALSGTFRFATGGAAKDKYLIKTATGTIGVRGTAFDFTVTPDATKVLLYHGSVLLCNLDQTCVTLDETCQLGAFDFGKSEILGNTDDFKGTERDAIKASFRYAVSQAPLLGQFRVEAARQCFQRGFEGGRAAPSLVAGETAPPEQVIEDPCDDGCDSCHSECCPQ